VECADQNQYIALTNSSSKKRPNTRRMANASNSGSSGSTSGSFAKLVQGLGLKGPPPSRGDSAQLSMGLALTNRPSRQPKEVAGTFRNARLPRTLVGWFYNFLTSPDQGRLRSQVLGDLSALDLTV
jgi:hypothetical protein